MTTWSLRQALATIDGDLPDGFDASAGVLSLFPTGHQATISQLQRYLFRQQFTLTTSRLQCVAEVKATGSGKWSLSGTVTSADSVDLIPLHYIVGFTFTDPAGDSGRAAFISGGLPIHTGVISEHFTTSGRDDWIVRAFADGITGHLNVSQDVGEFIHDLRILAGIGTLVVLSGGTVTIFFGG